MQDNNDSVENKDKGFIFRLEDVPVTNRQIYTKRLILILLLIGIASTFLQYSYVDLAGRFSTNVYSSVRMLCNTIVDQDGNDATTSYLNSLDDNALLLIFSFIYYIILPIIIFFSFLIYFNILVFKSHNFDEQLNMRGLNVLGFIFVGCGILLQFLVPTIAYVKFFAFGYGMILTSISLFGLYYSESIISLFLNESKLSKTLKNG